MQVVGKDHKRREGETVRKGLVKQVAETDNQKAGLQYDGHGKPGKGGRGDRFFSGERARTGNETTKISGGYVAWQAERMGKEATNFRGEDKQRGSPKKVLVRKERKKLSLAH